MTVLFYTCSCSWGEGGEGQGRGNLTSHSERYPGEKGAGGKKNAFGTEVIFCALGLPFVIYARRGRRDGGGEGTVEEKSPQIINNNSGFAIDSFLWDFPREPISASC